jgi:hypothetical protein
VNTFEARLMLVVMAAREQFRVLITNANYIVGSGCKPRMRDPSAHVRRYGYSGRHLDYCLEVADFAENLKPTVKPLYGHQEGAL